MSDENNATICFTVLGQPIPQGRVRLYRDKNGHSQAVTPARSREYKYLVQAAIKVALRSSSWKKTDRPVGVFCRLYRSGIRKADVDNLAKSLLDGCNCLLWDDDQQVEILVVHKEHRSNDPRAEVFVWKI